MNDLKLLCTDLDRTLIPNGVEPETPGVREHLADLLLRHRIRLVFVTGRDQALVREAITEYRLPAPDFVIADVGTTIYQCQPEAWGLLPGWQQHIGADWQFRDARALYEQVADMPGLQLQEAGKQGRYKLSFYVPLTENHTGLMADMLQRFRAQNLQANLVYSIDDLKHVGLLDVLPASASKRRAIEYLLDFLGLGKDQCLCAGDSGNDLDVLCSDLPAVLVANASEAVRQEASHLAQTCGTQNRLYLARGIQGKGNYAGGILEAVDHYFPHLEHPDS